jgi:hypothetical protein
MMCRRRVSLDARQDVGNRGRPLDHELGKPVDLSR